MKQDDSAIGLAVAVDIGVANRSLTEDGYFGGEGGALFGMNSFISSWLQNVVVVVFLILVLWFIDNDVCGVDAGVRVIGGLGGCEYWD